MSYIINPISYLDMNMSVISKTRQYVRVNEKVQESSDFQTVFHLLYHKSMAQT